MDASADITGGDLSSTVFPFFRFPRELRDAVYLELASGVLPIKTEATGSAIAFSVEGGFLANLLLVSRQFSDEVQDCFEKTAKLIARDTGESYVTRTCYRIPMALVFIQSLELHLFAGSGWPHRELRDHLRWMPIVIGQIPRLKSLQINIYLQRTEGKSEQSLEQVMRHNKTAWELSRVTALQMVSAVRVFSCDHDVEGCLDIEATLGNGTFLLGVWRREGDWQRTW